MVWFCYHAIKSTVTIASHGSTCMCTAGIAICLVCAQVRRAYIVYIWPELLKCWRMCPVQPLHAALSAAH